MKTERGVKSIGRFIVADPGICHGQPTFRGTRILVADALDQVASGMACEAIIHAWDNAISEKAIREAVDLASEALLNHVDEFLVEALPA